MSAQTLTGASTVPREKRDDITVKIDRQVFRKAKLICAHRDIGLAEYLSAILAKPVDRDYREYKKELSLEDE